MRDLFTLIIVVLLSSGAFGQANPPDSGQIRTLSSYVVFSAFSYEDGTGEFLKSPSAVFYDEAASEVFVATGSGRIVVYDTSLIPKYSFLHYVPEPGSDNIVRGEPKSLVVRSDGDILVTDNLTTYVDVLSFRGEPYLRLYPNRLLGDSTLNVRAGLLAIDEMDNLYILVSGDTKEILVLDKDFNLKRRISPSKGSNQDFNTPVGLAVYQDKVIVGDIYAVPAIKIFDTVGNYISGFGGHEIDRADFSYPLGIAVDRDSTGAERLWIADGLRQVVKVLSLEGQFISNIGGYGDRIGEFTYPSGLTGGTNNTFFIVEKVAQRIQKFEILQNPGVVTP